MSAPIVRLARKVDVPRIQELEQTIHRISGDFESFMHFKELHAVFRTGLVVAESGDSLSYLAFLRSDALPYLPFDFEPAEHYRSRGTHVNVISLGLTPFGGNTDAQRHATRGGHRAALDAHLRAYISDRSLTVREVIRTQPRLPEKPAERPRLYGHLQLPAQIAFTIPGYW